MVSYYSLFVFFSSIFLFRNLCAIVAPDLAFCLDVVVAKPTAPETSGMVKAGYYNGSLAPRTSSRRWHAPAVSKRNIWLALFFCGKRQGQRHFCRMWYRRKCQLIWQLLLYLCLLRACVIVIQHGFSKVSDAFFCYSLTYYISDLYT